MTGAAGKPMYRAFRGRNTDREQQELRKAMDELRAERDEAIEQIKWIGGSFKKRAEAAEAENNRLRTAIRELQHWRARIGTGDDDYEEDAFVSYYGQALDVVLALDVGEWAGDE